MSHQVRWTIPKIKQRLGLIEPLVYRRRHTIPAFRFLPLSSALEKPPIEVAVDASGWTTIEPYTYWGEWKQNFVLRSSFEIPADWGKDLPFALSLPIGTAGDFSHPEALAYVDGVSYAACDRHHHEFALRPDWQDGKTHTLALHGWTAAGGDQGVQLLMKPCEVVQVDQPTRDFIATARVALGAAEVLTEATPAKGKLLYALDRAFILLDTREPFGDGFYASVPAAHAALQEGIDQAGPSLDVEVIATGHAHIDVAWLWTLGQTRRKASRTFHTVDRLMDQFPDYHYTQSQPQLYDYIRQDHPDLFEAIKQRVAEGRWELTGGMWVEADCNLSGAESLARQFLLGRTFFEKHFGPNVETPVLWLPDVFGYAWALPQLIKQAGLEYFFTIKIGWSQYNRLPFDSFWWQGIDGTRILTHFSPTPAKGSAYASTYNAMANPEDILESWNNFRQKDLGHDDVTPPVLTAFGYGDGGGGPTREMLENLREMKEFPAFPRTRQSDVGSFFRQLEETSGELLPTWNGELYLEYHRGTYTTQSRNKRNNRKSEFLMHDAEFLAAQAAILSKTYRYPTKDIAQAWQLICLNQFHDIIPGSSIHDVYVESSEQYRTVAELGTGVRDNALKAISEQVMGDLLLVNPTSFERQDLAFWPQSLPAGQHLQVGQTGEPVFTQSSKQGTWLAASTLAPLSINSLEIVNGTQAKPDTGLRSSKELLENRFVRIELNDAGDIVRVFDKRESREVLPEGAIANQFQAFEDRPMSWDAWDVDIFFDDKQWLAEPATSIRLVEQGPLRATIEVQRQILHSHYTQLISLNYNSPQLDIATTIDWRERHILLKVAFPVDILSPVATYEIQWGNVQRPTHRNTSWDWARFETCANKWVDLSEGNYGVSVLNDCKYGHDIKENVIRISLLRSPTWPDPEADQGEHHFTYSLLPHAGNLNEETMGAAYALNDPLLVYTPERARASSKREQTPPLLSADKPNVIIETIKQAEDGNGIIVRLYESQRHRGNITLTAAFDLAEVQHTNLLEKGGEKLSVQGRQVTFFIKPYEIVTLRLVKKS